MTNNLTHKEALDLLEKYPAFTFAALQALRTSEDPAERQRLRSRIAAMTGDNASLREILGADSESLVNFYPDSVPPQLSTDDTITTFIDRFGPSGHSAEDMTPPVVAPEVDYASMLAGDDGNTDTDPAADSPQGDATTSAIDSFLKAVPPPMPARHTPPAYTPANVPAPAAPTPSAAPAPGAELTESFARIMIKNRNYKKALEIITELNLKNPQKSIYFADQIRFLKKLIAIESKGR